MLVPFFVFAVLVVCRGQESSTSQSVQSSTPKEAAVEKIDRQKSTQDVQTGNSLPFSNYQQETNPSRPGYHPRRLSDSAAPPRYDSRPPFGDNRTPLTQPNVPVALSDQANGATSRGSAQQNQPSYRSRPTATPNVPTYELGSSSEGEQPGFRYRPAQPSTQPRRISSPDQTYYQSRPDDELSYKPYSFNYVSEAEDGYYTHQQSADDSGKVVGSYSFTLEDGRKRLVDYVADQNGFRANIDTNEPGTSMEKNPADVFYYSTGSRSAWPGSRSVAESGSRPNFGAGRSATQGVSDSGNVFGRSGVQGSGLPPQAGIPSYQGREAVASGSPTTSYRGSGVPLDVMRPDVQGYQGNRLETGRPTATGVQDSRVRPDGGFNRNEGLAVERGPAFTSFLTPGVAPASQRNGERGTPTFPFNGEMGSEGFGITGRSGSRDFASGMSSSRTLGNGSAQREVRRDDERSFGSMRDSQQARAQSSEGLKNEENVPAVEYHVAHPHGGAPYYYYLDNGNYWYHRH